MNHHLYIVFILFLSWPLNANSVVVDFRHRPPEMEVMGQVSSGPIKQLIDEFLKQHNLVADFQLVPWPRTINRAQKGQVDLLPRHSMNRARESYLLPMLMGYEERKVVYLLSPKIKNSERYSSLAALSQLKFGVLRNSFYSETLSVALENKQVFEANSTEQLMHLLLKGRIDVLPIQNIAWANSAFDRIRSQFKNVTYHIAPYGERSLAAKYISLSKYSEFAYLYQDLNCTLFKMRKSGQIDRIYQQYQVGAYKQEFDLPESIAQEKSCLNDEE